MANAQRAPKQWCLTKHETVNSFENWRQNLIYTLSLDQNFAPFLVDGVQWTKKTKHDQYRGFQDDPNTVPEAQRKTTAQKASMLELMLGQIANFCPVIARNTIVKSSTSVNNIWQTIRLHYGFQNTGAHLIDFAFLKLEPNERPEDLYQRIMAFAEDNLLQQNSSITHHGEHIEEDEELTPSLENFLVLTWLRLIHSDLPKLVKQRYGTELRSRTLASIKPEISQALESLLEELHGAEDAKAMRTAVSQFGSVGRRPPTKHGSPLTFNQGSSSISKICPLCKTAGRPHGHFLSRCTYLPAQDRKYLARARLITGDDIDGSQDELDTPLDISEPSGIIANRVFIRQSPYLDAFYLHHPLRLTIDSGATGNMIQESLVSRLKLPVVKSTQSARQADGSSPLQVVGETRFHLQHGNHLLHFEGLVVNNLETEILAGIPFMEYNDIAIRPLKHQITIANDTVFNYDVKESGRNIHSVNLILRGPPTSSTVWPGEYLEVSLPGEIGSQNDIYAVEPHTPNIIGKEWPQPSLMTSISRKIRIPNLTTSPISIRKNEHICRLRSTYSPVQTLEKSEPNIGVLQVNANSNAVTTPIAQTNHTSTVTVDPDEILPVDVRSAFNATLHEYDNVFNNDLPGYNGHFGSLEAKVNMGPTQPPQRKGRVPQYSKDQLNLLQEKFDYLEKLGVFCRPEDLDTNIEYVNPSFLVKKASGDYRLVTAFTDVGRYSKPQPSMMPDVDSTLRQIAQWKYIIVTDLTKAYYQIPLAMPSRKYCGVVTPFKGVRAYARCAMGIPGSESALEELTCRIFGDFVQDGFVAKLADDLYIGGNTPQELHDNWCKVLHNLSLCNLRLSPSKTIIAPTQATILGWIWRLGTLQASPHRITTLATCPLPTTVLSLRSFIGAYKVLSRVLKDCSHLLAPLDRAIAGRESKETLNWTPELTKAYQQAQTALASNKSITLPTPDDQLWLVTDGALRSQGLGATLYISRNDKLQLSGFFSARLRQNQTLWLPCEIEALSIATAIKHFSPYIIQAKGPTHVLTDSKPCVQAYEKLSRGEFSTSPRVLTFLSTASRYHVSIQHISGAAILQSDFASRNAPDCNEPMCQICNFIQASELSVVRNISTKDILNGSVKLPFTSRSAWLATQSECPDLRRTRAHLTQGTRPSKKVTNAKDIKRYLHVTQLAPDGLVIVKRQLPFMPTQDCIVVPRGVLDGLLMSLHIKLDHPSTSQLKSVVSRYFYALDLDQAVSRIHDGCHTCASIAKTPHFQIPQTTCDPPESIGLTFAADIMKRERQLLLVLRETVTSYTSAIIITDEKHDTIREGLIQLCIGLNPLDGPFAVIRTDPAPGFVALVNDDTLRSHRLVIEIGRHKNINKNPVAEKAIQELENEIRKVDPTCRSLSPVSLAIAVAHLNSRLRKRGLSAREMFTQRDQYTNTQIPFEDQNIILQQNNDRMGNHIHSQRSKAPRAHLPPSPKIDIGDLVYLYCDGNKHKARDRYLVVSRDGDWCNIRKFIGSQLRKTSYRVKLSECYKVQSNVATKEPFDHNSQESDDSDLENTDSQIVIQPNPVTPVTPIIPELLVSPNEDTCSSTRGGDSAQLTDEVPNNNNHQHTLPTVPPNNTTRPTRPTRIPKRFEDYVLM